MSGCFCWISLKRQTKLSWYWDAWSKLPSSSHHAGPFPWTFLTNSLFNIYNHHQNFNFDVVSSTTACMQFRIPVSLLNLPTNEITTWARGPSHTFPVQWRNTSAPWDNIPFLLRLFCPLGNLHFSLQPPKYPLVTSFTLCRFPGLVLNCSQPAAKNP